MPGVSGNPRGRPPGRKNQIDQLKQDLEIAVRSKLKVDRVVKIIDKMCDLAENGDTKAAKLILSMAVSPAKASDDANDNANRITVIVENATFAARPQPQAIEAKVVEENKNVD